jgi:nucleotide-binding universal stress UspA family protein
MAPAHVLVPLDGSPLADDALVHTLETFDCRVTVLNVVTPMDSSMSEGGVLEPGDQRKESARDRANRLIDRAKSRAEEMGRSVDTVVETGDPADTIVDVATERDVDHIVMGGHGGDRHELTRRLLGTVATDVVGGAPMTVTVVR